jgi:hypothetical protein
MVIFTWPYRMHLVSGHLELSKVIVEPVGNSPPPEVTVSVIGAVLSTAVPAADTICALSSVSSVPSLPMVRLSAVKTIFDPVPAVGNV